MSNRPLSLDDFKDWLSKQQDMSQFFNLNKTVEGPDDKFIGCAVTAKVSESKLLKRIETEENPELLVRELLEDGGTVLAIDGTKIQIEVDSGTFFVPRFCVKIQEAEE